MAVIDADAHVVETEKTWDYIPASDQHLRPVIVEIPDASGRPKRHWLVDGRVRRPAGEARDLPRTPEEEQRSREELERFSRVTGRNVVTPPASRHMLDVSARLRHMDELGIDYQFLYPTIFSMKLAERHEVQVAMSQGYNRWMADVWSQSHGRLSWACVLPVDVMDEAIKELHWAVDHGARGVHFRGMEDDRAIHDPYFFPLYQEMSRLNVPVTVHIGNANPDMNAMLSYGSGGSVFSATRLMSVAACHSWILGGLPQEFPDLRIIFVEAAAGWVPYVVQDLRRRFPGRHGRPAPANLLKESRVWVACQTDDDLDYVLQYAGEDNLVIGTDYGHTDHSSEVEAMRNLRAQGKLAPRVADKILGENAAVVYAL